MSRREDNIKMVPKEMELHAVDGSRLTRVTDSGGLL